MQEYENRIMVLTTEIERLNSVLRSKDQNSLEVERLSRLNRELLLEVD